MKKAMVLGAGGFIGNHLVRRLKSKGYWVKGVDRKHPEFSRSEADEFVVGDLRDKSFVEDIVAKGKEIENKTIAAEAEILKIVNEKIGI